jgi:hypothetical protein
MHEDYIGKKINLLTILFIYKKDNIVFCDCICDCGVTCTKLFKAVRYNNVKSCGHLSLTHPSNVKKMDIVGKRFGRLTVIEEVCPKTTRNSKFVCLCDCGEKRVCFGFSLKDGTTQSCGCYNRDIVRTHGLTKSSEYSAYRSMIDRCYNEKNKKYPIYGGRGISVCEEWLKGFDFFISDMGLKNNSKFSLDRINTNLGYSKENCRWANITTQNRNRRNSIYFQIGEENLHITEWAKRLNVKIDNIYNHLKKGKDFNTIYTFFKNKQKLK